MACEKKCGCHGISATSPATNSKFPKSTLERRACRIISSEISIPTTRPSGTSFASRRESHPAPQPTSSTLSVAASRIFSSTGSVIGRWSCSISAPRPASAQRSNSSRRVSLEVLSVIRRELCALHFCQQLHKLLLPLRLVVPAFGIRHLRDVHRAEFRPAHRAELRLFVEIIGKILIVHLPRRFRIERKFKLFIPIKQESRIAQSVIAVARPRPVPRHVRGVRRNFVRDHALLHVFRIR